MAAQRLAGMGPYMGELLAEPTEDRMQDKRHMRLAGTTAGLGVLMSTAMDADGFYTEQQVLSILERMNKEREGQQRVEDDLSDDEQRAANGRICLIDKLGGREDAAITIQRAYRAYRKRQNKRKYMSKTNTIKMADYIVPERFYNPRSRFKALHSYSIKAAGKDADDDGDALIEEEEGGERLGSLRVRDPSPSARGGAGGGGVGYMRRSSFAGSSFGVGSPTKETTHPTYHRAGASSQNASHWAQLPSPAKSPTKLAGGHTLQCDADDGQDVSLPAVPRALPRSFSRSISHAGGHGGGRGAQFIRASYPMSEAETQQAAAPSATAAALTAAAAAASSPEALAQLARSITRQLNRSSSGQPLRPSISGGPQPPPSPGSGAAAPATLADEPSLLAVPEPPGPSLARNLTRSVTACHGSRGRGAPASAVTMDPDQSWGGTALSSPCGSSGGGGGGGGGGPDHGGGQAAAASGQGGGAQAAGCGLLGLNRTLGRSLTHSASHRTRCPSILSASPDVGGSAELTPHGSSDAAVAAAAAAASPHDGASLSRQMSRSNSGRPLRPSISGAVACGGAPDVPGVPLPGSVPGQSPGSQQLMHMPSLTGLSESGLSEGPATDHSRQHSPADPDDGGQHCILPPIAHPDVRAVSPTQGVAAAAAATGPGGGHRARSEAGSARTSPSAGAGAGGGGCGGGGGACEPPRGRSRSLVGAVSERPPAALVSPGGSNGGSRYSSNGSGSYAGGAGGSGYPGPEPTPPPLVLDPSVLSPAAAAFLAAEPSGYSVHGSGGGGGGGGQARRVSASHLGPGVPSAGLPNRPGPPVMVGGWVGGRQSIGGSPLGPAQAGGPARPPAHPHPHAPSTGVSPAKKKKAPNGKAGMTLFEEWKKMQEKKELAVGDGGAEEALAAGEGGEEAGPGDGGDGGPQRKPVGDVGESFLSFVQRRMGNGAVAAASRAKS